MVGNHQGCLGLLLDATWAFVYFEAVCDVKKVVSI